MSNDKNKEKSKKGKHKSSPVEDHQSELAEKSASLDPVDDKELSNNDNDYIDREEKAENLSTLSTGDKKKQKSVKKVSSKPINNDKKALTLATIQAKTLSDLAALRAQYMDATVALNNSEEEYKSACQDSKDNPTDATLVANEKLTYDRLCNAENLYTRLTRKIQDLEALVEATHPRESSSSPVANAISENPDREVENVVNGLVELNQNRFADIISLFLDENRTPEELKTFIHDRSAKYGLVLEYLSVIEDHIKAFVHNFPGFDRLCKSQLLGILRPRFPHTQADFDALTIEREIYTEVKLMLLKKYEQSNLTLVDLILRMDRLKLQSPKSAQLFFKRVEFCIAVSDFSVRALDSCRLVPLIWSLIDPLLQNHYIGAFTAYQLATEEIRNVNDIRNCTYYQFKTFLTHESTVRLNCTIPTLNVLSVEIESASGSKLLKRKFPSNGDSDDNAKQMKKTKRVKAYCSFCKKVVESHIEARCRFNPANIKRNAEKKDAKVIATAIKASDIPPSNYVCNKCNVAGHYIRLCPLVINFNVNYKHNDHELRALYQTLDEDAFLHDLENVNLAKENAEENVHMLRHRAHELQFSDSHFDELIENKCCIDNFTSCIGYFSRCTSTNCALDSCYSTIVDSRKSESQRSRRQVQARQEERLDLAFSEELPSVSSSESLSNNLFEITSITRKLNDYSRQTLFELFQVYDMNPETEEVNINDVDNLEAKIHSKANIKPFVASYNMKSSCKNCILLPTSKFSNCGIDVSVSHSCSYCKVSKTPHSLLRRYEARNEELDVMNFTQSQSSSKYTSHNKRKKEFSKDLYKSEVDYLANKQKQLTQQQIDKRLELKALDELLLPIELQGNFKTLALFDTGCNYSAISKKLAENLRLNIFPTQGVSKSWDGTETPLFAVADIKVRYGNRSFTTRVDVCENLSHDMYVGCDLLGPLGISILGIETKFPQPSQVLKEVSSKPMEAEEAITTEDISPLRKIEENFDMNEGSSAFDKEYWKPTEPISEHEKVILQPHIDAMRDLNMSVLLGTFTNHELGLITLKVLPGSKPQFRKQYQLRPAMHEEVTKQVKIWLENKIICLADFGNKWNSAILAVDKKDPLTGAKTGYRVCIDYRPTNEVLDEPAVDNVPLISDLFQRVQGKNYFSALDMKWSFHQMEVLPSDREKTGFEWEGQRYIFRGAPFGIKTLTSRMHELASSILRDNHDHILIYVDDIIIMSDTLDEHIKQVRDVITKLTKANLRLNFEKCHFGFRSIQCLGHRISGVERSADPLKVESILVTPVPTSGKDIMKFLGKINFLRDYIPNISQIAAPLDKLRYVKKFSEKDWTPLANQSFLTLKECLKELPSLKPVLPKVELRVACDASQLGIGAVLYQVDPQSQEKRYIAFASRALNSGQRNYSATRRELLAVIFALQRFRFYLADVHFIVETDHRALMYMLHHTHSSYMINAWLDVLIDFDFTTVHIPGVLNVLPDALSRQYETFCNVHTQGVYSKHLTSRLEEGVELSSQTPRFLRVKRKTFAPKKKVKVPKVTIDQTFEHIFQERLEDKKRDIKLVNPLPLQDWVSRPDQEISEFIKDRLMKTVPPSNEREKMLQDVHNRCGHRGAEFMYKRLWYDGYYWPGMKKACTEIVEVCLPCLRWNVAKSGFHPMKGITSKTPFRHIAIDLADFTHVSNDDGYKYVLIIVDIFSKFVVLRPLREKTAYAIARQLFDVGNLVGHFKILQSDNGTEFENQILREYTRLNNAEHRFITPYHPNANGIAENTVRQVKSVLNKWTEGFVSQWPQKLSSIQYALNTNVTHLHGTAPFSIVFGRAVDPIIESSQSSRAETETGTTGICKPSINCVSSDSEAESDLFHKQILERIQVLNDLLFPEIANKIFLEKQHMSMLANKSRRIIKPLAIKTKVMLLDNLKIQSKTKPRYVGPYMVVMHDKRNNGYRLQGMDGALHPRAQPIEYLKVIKGDLPITQEIGESTSDAFHIEKIISHRNNEVTGDNEYLVKWKNYSDTENEWISFRNFVDQDIIRQYALGLQKNKSKIPLKQILTSRAVLTAPVTNKAHSPRKSQLPLGKNVAIDTMTSNTIVADGTKCRDSSTAKKRINKISVSTDQNSSSTSLSSSSKRQRYERERSIGVQSLLPTNKTKNTLVDVGSNSLEDSHFESENFRGNIPQCSWNTQHLVSGLYDSSTAAAGVADSLTTLKRPVLANGGAPSAGSPNTLITPNVRDHLNSFVAVQSSESQNSNSEKLGRTTVTANSTAHRHISITTSDKPSLTAPPCSETGGNTVDATAGPLKGMAQSSSQEPSGEARGRIVNPITSFHEHQSKSVEASISSNLEHSQVLSVLA